MDTSTPLLIDNYSINSYESIDIDDIPEDKFDLEPHYAMITENMYYTFPSEVVFVGTLLLICLSFYISVIYHDF